MVTLFSPAQGDVNFPGLSPTAPGGQTGIDNALIGQNTQGPVGASSFTLGSGTKTTIAVAGAATLAQPSGTIRTESLSTSAGSVYTMVITNPLVTANSIPFASVRKNTATTGTPVITSVAPGAGTLTVGVKNIDASAAFNGTFNISFAVLGA